MDSIELKGLLQSLTERLSSIKEDVFQISKKIDKLSQINNDLTKEEVWSDLELSQNLNK